MEDPPPQCGVEFPSDVIKDVEVCAYPVDFEADGACAVTNTEGRYTIPNLSPGSYEVEFWGRPAGYVLQYYDGKSARWEANPVVVGSGETPDIDAALVPITGISGTVTRSADGEPVEGVEVCAWMAVSEEFGGCDWTGPEGTYLIELEPGEYKVEFWPGETGQNLVYQVYDHGNRWRDADTVMVLGEEINDEVDAELDAGATISGKVVSAATGAPLEEVPVCSIDAPTGQLWTCNWTGAGGGYALPFLSAGQYKVVFSIDFDEWYGEEFLEPDDGYPTEFWDNQPTLATANAVPLSAGQALSGIDAGLGAPASPAAPSFTLVPPAASAPPPVATPPKRRCRRGFKKKLVKGKLRCVRKHRKHRQRRRGGSAGNGVRALR